MSTPPPHRVTVIPGDGVGPEVDRSAVRIIAAPASDRLGGGGGRRRGLQARRQLAASRAATARVDRAHRRRPQGPARDARSASARRAPTSRCASCSRRTPTSARRASCPGVPTRYDGRGRRLHRRPREHRGPVRRASSTCTPATSASASRSSAARARRRSSATPSSWPAREGRTKVTCATKANILKLTEGLFKRGLRGARAGVPGHHRRAPHHRQRRPPDGQGPGPVRHRRHHEPRRRHHQRPRVGPGRRARLRGVGNYGDERRDLRGGPRVGAEVRRQERHQPDRADPQLGDDAAPPRRGRGRRSGSRTPSS